MQIRDTAFLVCLLSSNSHRIITSGKSKHARTLKKESHYAKLVHFPKSPPPPPPPPNPRFPHQPPKSSQIRQIPGEGDCLWVARWLICESGFVEFYDCFSFGEELLCPDEVTYSSKHIECLCKHGLWVGYWEWCCREALAYVANSLMDRQPVCFSKKDS
ncbi:hypothetical protein AKJ16_DCAP00550 [Drosera capensis]